MVRQTLALVGVLPLLVGPALAQDWFADAREFRHLPLDHPYAWDAAAVDLDGDGDRDLVITGVARLLRNDGRARFTDVTATSLPPGWHAWRCVAPIDIDADGDADLFAGGEAGTMARLFVNDGRGHFTDETAARLPSALDHVTTCDVGDVDGDGDLDVIAGASQVFDPWAGWTGGVSRLYLNDGAGSFTDATAGRLSIAPSPELLDLSLVDLDRDGWLDLVVAHANGPQWLRGGANGVFTDVTAARLPALPPGAACVAASDVDGDGDLDLAIGYSSSAGQVNALLLDDGSGRFALAPAGYLPADADVTRDLVFADVDRDGDVDLLTGDTGLADPVVGIDKLYRNDGTGRFARASFPATLGSTMALAVADLDGDADDDVVAVGFGTRSRLYLGDGAGGFRDAARSALPATILAAADFDGDGDVDVIGEPNDADGARLFVNDGRGMFDMSAARLPGVATSSTLKQIPEGAVADLDRDGDPDFVLAVGHGYANLACSNDGAANFTVRSIPGSTQDTTSVVLGDVDGDGDIDAVFGNTYGSVGAQNNLFLSDGAGTFTAAVGALPAAVDRTEDVALGDVDGDGDLDLVAANLSGQSTLALNDGTGRFADATTARLPQVSLPTYGAALADLDGDGDLDLLLANDGQDSRWYRNDGTGTFTFLPAQLFAGAAGVRHCVAADFDADGDVDLAFAPYRGSNPVLFANDGAGAFRDVSGSLAALQVTCERVVAADLDGDGDLDLGFGGRGYHYDGQVQFNRLRSLETPVVPMLGGSLTLEVHAAGSRTPWLAIPVLAAASGFYPLPPLGTFRLDPAASVVLPGGWFPGSGAPLVLTLPVPNDPALFGTAVLAQALVAQFDPPMSVALTASVSLEIWR